MTDIHQSTERIPMGQRVAELADAHPDETAMVFVTATGDEHHYSWSEVEKKANGAARAMRQLGVTHESLVVIALPTSFAHVVTTIGAWKLGALVLPVDPGVTKSEQRELLALPGSPFVIADADWASISLVRLLDEPDQRPLLPPPGKPRSASATGGSTGKPRYVVLREWTYPAKGLPTSDDTAAGLRLHQVSLSSLPLFHAGFGAMHYCLALAHKVVILETFRPELFVEAIRRHKVNTLRTVPAAMRAVLDVPGISAEDFASMEAFHHTAASCPEPVKRAWLHLVRPEALYEDYDSVERIGTVSIRGHDWLEHPGSVGRPTGCEVRILSEDGAWAPHGEIGEVFMRSGRSRQPTYVGEGPPLREIDGFFSLGDMGYLDEEGWLYLAGRRSDIISVGGAKVMPKEVEEVLLAHPAVSDVAVVPRSHEYLGQSVHALVVTAPGAHVGNLDLYHHCRSRLVMEKVPLTFDFVSRIPRSAAGKLRRHALTDGL